MLQEILQNLSSSKSTKGSLRLSSGGGEESGEFFAGLLSQALKSTLKSGTLASTLTQKLEKEKGNWSVERGEKSSSGDSSNLVSPGSPLLTSLSMQGAKGTLKEANGRLKELLEEAKNGIQEAKSNSGAILKKERLSTAPIVVAQSASFKTPKESQKLSDVAKIAEDLGLKPHSIKAQSETSAQISPQSAPLEAELKKSQVLEKIVEKRTPQNIEPPSLHPEASPPLKNRSLALDSDSSVLRLAGENRRQEGDFKAPQAEANLAGILTLTQGKKSSSKKGQEAIVTEKQEAKESPKEKSKETLKEAIKEVANEATKREASPQESASKIPQESHKNPMVSAILESKEWTPKGQSVDEQSNPENRLKSALEELAGREFKQVFGGKKEESESKETTPKKSEVSMGAENRLSSLSEMKGDLALRSALAKETLKNFTATLKEEVQNYKPPLTKLSVELNPENLGSVEVTIMQRGQNLHVQVLSNTQAIQLFMNNATEFRQQLANAGFSEVSMSFGDKSASSGGFGGGDSSGGHPQKGNENGLFAYKANALGGADLEESERLGLMEITLPKYA